jgi:hypothetical protein
MKRALAGLVALLALAPPAAAAPAWLASEQRSASGDNLVGGWNSFVDQVAFNGRGDGVISWHRSMGFDPGTIQTAIHRPGAPPSWSSIQNVTPNDYNSMDGTGTRTGGFQPVTVDEAGNLFIFYSVQGAGGYRDFAYRTSPPGSTSWGPQTIIHDATSPVTENQSGFGAATSSDGTTLAIGSPGNQLRAYLRPPGGSFSQLGAGNLGTAGSVSGVAMNDAGDALVVQQRAPVAYYRIETYYRPRGSAFGSLVSFDVTANTDGEMPAGAVGGDGRAIVVFVEPDTPAQGNERRVRYALKPAGGAFGSANALSSDGVEASDPAVAMNESGEAVIAYVQNSQIYVTTIAPNGNFGGTVISDAASSAEAVPRVDINDAGEIAIVYNGVIGGQSVVRAVRRPAGEVAFTTPATISPSGGSSPNVALGSSGDALAGFALGSFPTIVRSAGFDASGPRIENVDFPATAVAQTAFAYSASVVDAWSPVANTLWLFGDGTSSAGNSGTKAYAAAGPATATVTATDTLGNSNSTTRDISVSAAPAGGGGGGGGGGGAGATAKPVLASLALSPSAFKAARSGASIMASAMRTGTTVSYVNTQASTTTFVVKRERAGFRRGRRCVARRPAGAPRPKRCTRLVRAGSFTHADEAGRVSFRFSGRVGGRKLRPGRYRLRATAQNALGRSAPLSKRFRVRR